MKRQVIIFFIFCCFMLSCSPEPDISLECKTQMEYGRLPAGEFHISQLGECVYDFLLFIEDAELIAAKTTFGGKANVTTFFDKHMALYTATYGNDEKTEKKERALARYFITENKHRRRYYVDKVYVDFEVVYDTAARHYTFKSRIRCDEEIKVFYGTCELETEEQEYDFSFYIPEADAEKLSFKDADSMILNEKIFLYPYQQGIYKPSWLFKDVKYVAKAKFGDDAEFKTKIESGIKKKILAELYDYQ